MGEILHRSSSKGELKCCVMLSKDHKAICRAWVDNAPVQVPYSWRLDDMVKITKLPFLAELQQFTLSQAAESSRDEKEWHRFLNFLRRHDQVGIVRSECVELYILPPDTIDSNKAIAAYRVVKSQNPKCSLIPSQPNVEVKEQDNVTNGGIRINDKNVTQTLEDPRCMSKSEDCSRRPESCGPKQSGITARNYARADPSYLKTLGQAHSGWLFGAIAELVDNSRDAKATKLEISIEMIYSKIAGKTIPMMSVIDDGHGMTHEDVVRMTSLGHKAPDEDDTDRIGRFGVGFKTGAMRLGKDALVLTQTADSRSIAFLSQSLNDGKDNLEIPIVSFHRQGHVMEVETHVQSEALAKYNLKAIKEFSPFNKYLIGEKAALFHEHTGTQIYIWNLDEWGSDYSLMWQEKSSFSLGDICVRSKRIRSRPGQISTKVPLDYSLRTYLEVIFLVPRIQIYVQGSRVKTRPLEKSLHKTVVEVGVIMGKRVQLTLGRCQLEWDKANCGIFLYWRGRLIEAYKRVGGMIHSGTVGRGVIGVVDVTDLMNDGKGGVWVLNNKQGFQDCESYAKLEKWLGLKSDIYWDNNFDRLQPTATNLLYKPDHDWVQCNKCRKWRMLSSDFNIDDLPDEWFCYMEPYSGCCEIPEEKVKGGLITLSTKRARYEYSESSDREENVSDPSTDNDMSSQSIPLVGLRKARTRACKKKPR